MRWNGSSEESKTKFIWLRIQDWINKTDQRYLSLGSSVLFCIVERIIYTDMNLHMCRNDMFSMELWFPEKNFMLSLSCTSLKETLPSNSSHQTLIPPSWLLPLQTMVDPVEKIARFSQWQIPGFILNLENGLSLHDRNICVSLFRFSWKFVTRTTYR